MKKSILIMFHCEQHTGFAIEKLESIFHKAAVKAKFIDKNIHWSYSHVTDDSNQIHELDYQSKDISVDLSKILIEKNIDIILAFDFLFRSKIVSIAKKHGVENIVSYWGASMSGINSGLKLGLKKIEYWLFQHSAADMYIFESKAMQLTATHGRGIHSKRTSVIPLGVNSDEYHPAAEKSYIHKQLNIPKERKVVFYSGHMEERKGIRTIVKAARELARLENIQNLHFVLCGNKGNEAATYLSELDGSIAIDHVTFAGYRSDVPALMRSSDIGVIASTGWDSFTRSSIEMLASGLPLIASDLGGLAETTKHNETGYLFTPGDFSILASHIVALSTDQKLYREMSLKSRVRAITYFSETTQIQSISELLLKG